MLRSIERSKSKILLKEEYEQYLRCHSQIQIKYCKKTPMNRRTKYIITGTCQSLTVIDKLAIWLQKNAELTKIRYPLE